MKCAGAVLGVCLALLGGGISLGHANDEGFQVGQVFEVMATMEAFRNTTSGTTRIPKGARIYLYEITQWKSGKPRYRFTVLPDLTSDRQLGDRFPSGFGRTPENSFSGGVDFVPKNLKSDDVYSAVMMERFFKKAAEGPKPPEPVCVPPPPAPQEPVASVPPLAGQGAGHDSEEFLERLMWTVGSFTGLGAKVPILREQAVEHFNESKGLNVLPRNRQDLTNESLRTSCGTYNAKICDVFQEEMGRLPTLDEFYFVKGVIQDESMASGNTSMMCRYESHLGCSSYGPMHVLEPNLRAMGFRGDPQEIIKDPEIGIGYGVKFILRTLKDVDSKIQISDFYRKNADFRLAHIASIYNTGKDLFTLPPVVTLSGSVAQKTKSKVETMTEISDVRDEGIRYSGRVLLGAAGYRKSCGYKDAEAACANRR